MINKFFIGTAALFLGMCSVFIAQIIVNRHFDTQQQIVLVQSDLFKDVSYIKLEELIKDDTIAPLFLKEDKIDLNFKIALFYSDLSIIILKKSKEQRELEKYVGDLYKKSLIKWDDLIQKDKSMLFFKNYYVKAYKTALDYKTNSK